LVHVLFAGLFVVLGLAAGLVLIGLAVVVFVVVLFDRGRAFLGFLDFLLGALQEGARVHERVADDPAAAEADEDGEQPHGSARQEKRDRRDDDADFGAELRALVPLARVVMGLDCLVVRLGVLLRLFHVVLVLLGEVLDPVLVLLVGREDVRELRRRDV